MKIYLICTSETYFNNIEYFNYTKLEDYEKELNLKVDRVDIYCDGIAYMITLNCKTIDNFDSLIKNPFVKLCWAFEYYEVVEDHTIIDFSENSNMKWIGIAK